MQISPYLNFNRNCAEAMQFYAKVLGGKDLRILSFRDTPMRDQVPADQKDLVAHARFSVGNFTIMASDATQGYNKPQGYAVNISVETPAEADRIFAALSDGGNIGMPISETFFAKRFGMTTDKFGTHWMVICEKPM